MAMRKAFNQVRKIFKRGFWNFTKKRTDAFDGPTIYQSDYNSYEIIYSKYGDPEKVLFDQFHPVPDPESTEVKVRMLMAPVNTSDLAMIYGSYFVLPDIPAFAGNEGVGEVMDIGDEVKALRAGDWVMPLDLGLGTWRTLAIVDEEDLIRIPNDIPVVSAAMLGVNPCTAYRILKGFVDLKPGDSVIQNGANSSVGQAVIQLCKYWGINTINIVRHRHDNEGLARHLRNLGAHYIVTDRFIESEDMKFFLNSLARPPKLAIDCLGGRVSRDIPYIIGEDGVHVYYGAMAHEQMEQPDGMPKLRQVQVKGYWDSTWDHSYQPNMKLMVAEIGGLMRERKFRPPRHEIFPVTRYPYACRLAKEVFRSHKVLLKLSEDIPDFKFNV